MKNLRTYPKSFQGLFCALLLEKSSAQVLQVWGPWDWFVCIVVHKNGANEMKCGLHFGRKCFTSVTTLNIVLAGEVTVKLRSHRKRKRFAVKNKNKKNNQESRGQGAMSQVLHGKWICCCLTFWLRYYLLVSLNKIPTAHSEDKWHPFLLVARSVKSRVCFVQFLACLIRSSCWSQPQVAQVAEFRHWEFTTQSYMMQADETLLETISSWQTNICSFKIPDSWIDWFKSFISTKVTYHSQHTCAVKSKWT